MELNDEWFKTKRVKMAYLRQHLLSHIYRLKTTQMSNDKGTWFGWEVSKAGPVTDSQAYQQAKTFSETHF